MSKQLLPHTTRNTALAVVAFLLRIPITRRRVYTEEFLQKSGLTAKEAFRRGILGQFDYTIPTNDDPVAARVVKAFNDEKIRIEEGNDTTEIEVDVEVIARICARVLYARKNFMADLQTVVPFLRINNPGTVQKSAPGPDGSHTKQVPGFKDIRIDADEVTKSHLRLQ